MSDCFNTDVSFWENLLASRPAAVLKIKEGHVYIEGEYLGQFASSKEAFITLQNANWPHKQIEILDPSSIQP